jgi:hypothetical protein
MDKNRRSDVVKQSAVNPKYYLLGLWLLSVFPRGLVGGTSETAARRDREAVVGFTFQDETTWVPL